MKTKFNFYLALMSLVVFGEAALAGTITISQQPLFTTGADKVKPNIMFILDDSGSMNDDEMPDYVAYEALCKGPQNCTFGDPPYNSTDFNGIYYNPLVVYQPGVTNDGVTAMANQVRVTGGVKRWDQVQTDPYLYPSNKVSVETISDKIYCKVNSPTPAQKATADSTGADCRKNGKTYSGTAVGYAYPDNTYKYTVPISNAPYYYSMTVDWCKSNMTSCQSAKDATYAYARFTNVTRTEITTAMCTPKCVSGRTYDDEMTNYANWYAYYRTRLLMAKTSAGLAFSILSDNTRVGYMTIHTTDTSSPEYLMIAEFVPAGQRKNWYDKLYNSTTNGGTPLKSALSLAGRMYAGVALNDPVQQSCQKNWSILTTDGYWNSGSSAKIDGTTVGNQDSDSGIFPRPKYDGGLSGSSDTLADVAAYYYRTDLRPAMPNDVSGTSRDPASHQHMTTYTIGLGVSGQLIYRPDYETAITGDFAQLKSGTKDWPSPVSGDLTTVDDLWHAAVNGGGIYYSARSPQALVLGLMDALRSINAEVGAAAAAATSNPNVVAGDNFIFSSTYQTKVWDGELTRQQIDPASGSISATIDWSARTQLNTQVSASTDTRTINTWSGSGPTNMMSFQWGNLSAAQKAWFSPTLVSQYASLTVAGKALVDTAGSMVGYLRGQTGLEDDAGSADLPYRGRDYALGDIVSGEAVYVKRPRFKYSDAGYLTWAGTNAIKNRQAMVYTPANDGMLHAINADTGVEAWAYVPTMVMPNMSKLADKLYDHQFYVDGTPVVGDVYDGTKWRTILVGGLNVGGVGYYALDITDPASPIALWQFCNDSTRCNKVDANIGLSFGNPIITKVKGQWTVLFSSGYNNADGKGYLYMVDPITGTQRSGSPVLVASGCTGGHCGLAKIAGWTDESANNSTTDVYGGDLDGHVWRIQVAKRQGEATDPATPIVTLLAELTGGAVGRQPVTAKPELGEFDGHRIVMVGTGKFLNNLDPSDSSKQTFYGLKDALGPTGLGQVHAPGVLVAQTLTETTYNGKRVRTASNNNVDWDVTGGWYVDLPDSGERVTGDPSLSLGTITFTSNVPTVGVTCSDADGGYSFLYNLNFRTGGFVSGANTAANTQPVASEYLTTALATRPVVVKLPDGKLVAIITLSNGQKLTGEVPYPKGFKGRRSSWREIIIK